MEIRQDMLIGFGVLFASAIVIHLILVNAAKGKSKDDESSASPRSTKVNNLFVRAVYPVLIGGFVIAMLWTGFSAKPDEKEPQGELDQKNKPGVMTYEKGSNSPEEARKRLDAESDTDLKESMEDLERFRKDKMKNTEKAETDKGESK